MAKHASTPIQIIEGKNFKPQRWSGGTTTEFFIYPEKSSYAARNFDFRLSMATVEVEESDFTPLPDIFRKTLILEGEITLSHNDDEAVKYGKHDVATYDGGWKTKSVGKCTDFNLMTKGRQYGSLEAKTLEAGEQWIIPASDHNFLYVYRGRLAIIEKRDAQLAEEGSLIISNKNSGPHLLVKAIESCEIVSVRV